MEDEMRRFGSRNPHRGCHSEDFAGVSTVRRSGERNESSFSAVTLNTRWSVGEAHLFVTAG